MSLRKSLRPRWEAAGLYLFTAILSLLLLFSILGLKREAVRLPFTYQGDAMFYHVLIKGMIDHGWFLENPNLAAPEALNLRDVPSTDNNLYYVLLKLIALVKPMYPQVLNAFFLLGFPLTAISALYVLRHFGVSDLVAVFAALVYAFLPYHFIRGQHHLFLSAYYFVPPMIMIVLWIGRGEWTLADWRSKKGLFSLLVCLLVASTGYYYAFFACFFLLAAGITAALATRRASGLLTAAALTAVIFTGVAVNFLPSVSRFSSQGGVHFVRRIAGEADDYGLRFAQLVMPVRWHRARPLSELKEDYNMRLMINENDDASLGFIGSFGFIGLLVWFLFRKPSVRGMNEAGPAGLLNHLSLHTLAALLLGTIGGIGSLVAFFGLPQVRAYNRISIFIAFFALLAAALWMDGWARKFLRTTSRMVVFGAALGLLLSIGMLDQISPHYLPDYRKAEDEFMSDDVFVKQIESLVPPGAMIFQLPVVSFPENPRVNRLLDYDLARGYLHSKTLRWTYGAIKGRDADVWQRMVAARPVREMIETLAWSGFSGIYIDRFGFADSAASIESELRQRLGARPLRSPNERLLFFDLTGYRNQIMASVAEKERVERQQAALYPVMALWQSGFQDQEGSVSDNWRWCGAEGEMKIINPTGRPQQVKLEMFLSADNGGELSMESAFFNERFRLDRWGKLYEKTFVVPPGRHPVRFRCDAERVLPPNDFRELVFRVRNFNLAAVGGLPMQDQAGQPQREAILAGSAAAEK
jgi:phosphoglycerol transferase